MKSTEFGLPELDELRRIKTAKSPATIVLVLGIPGILLLTMCSCCAMPAVASGGASSTKSSDDPRTTVAALGVCFAPFAGIIGSGGLFFLYRKLNADFEQSNVVSVDYSMQEAKNACYNKLLKSFDRLRAAGTLIEITDDAPGEYVVVGNVNPDVRLPKNLISNKDVYRIQIGGLAFYMLPDCILIDTGGDYQIMDWDRVSVRAVRLTGTLRRVESEPMLIHGRITKSGGLDRRYRARYAKAPKTVYYPIELFGTAEFHFGRRAFLVISSDKGLFPHFEVAFREWAETRRYLL